MPRRPRHSTGGIAYHVLNRRVGRLELFEKPFDYSAFENILVEAYHRTGIRVAAYCLMPNHWHLLLWPRTDGELSEIMRWITVTHTQRWHAHRHSSGTGPVYQGRFKSFPVQTDEHFITAARYVERNALRAKLVERAEEWRWSRVCGRRGRVLYFDISDFLRSHQVVNARARSYCFSLDELFGITHRTRQKV